MKTAEMVLLLETFVADHYEVMTGEMDEDQIFAVSEETRELGGVSYKINRSVEINRIK